MCKRIIQTDHWWRWTVTITRSVEVKVFPATNIFYEWSKQKVLLLKVGVFLLNARLILNLKSFSCVFFAKTTRSTNCSWFLGWLLYLIADLEVWWSHEILWIVSMRLSSSSGGCSGSEVIVGTRQPQISSFHIA